MKEYIRPLPDKMPDWCVPRLYEGRAPEDADFDEIRNWCLENCQSNCYFYPAWSGMGAQFEDSDEAERFMVWARLRWG